MHVAVPCLCVQYGVIEQNVHQNVNTAEITIREKSGLFARNRDKT